MTLTDTHNVPATLILEGEERLAGEIGAWLETNCPSEIDQVRSRFKCLRDLGAAVAQYPSVRKNQFPAGEIRNEEKLIEALCSFSSPFRLLRIPSKVAAIRSFLVAKFHTFSMLGYLVHGEEALSAAVKNVNFSIICTLMAEEVYFSCLEDPSFPSKIKGKIANDLVSLWDYGTDPRVVRHLPALQTLWAVRDQTPPSFGTMDGTSELVRITIDMDKGWQEFIAEEISDEETRWALEEFLFGLSYEEIQKVRNRLARFGVAAVGYDEIRSYLGSKPLYTQVKDDDPRAIYDFFVDRRDAGRFRKRLFTPGPRHTLEEIYLKYRIYMEMNNPAAEREPLARRGMLFS
ncbi:MAG: hypothetical protein LBS06_01120 [Treponema sp.]|jgi:hypothetical protein|nr:hypothetical protein [Treponema sp.]